MSQLFFILAILTAGVSLSMGTISFLVGLKRQDKTNLILGIMGLCLFLFIMLPPVGFITVDQPPYQIELIFKRIFIFTYYGIFPWFVFFYTNSQKKIVPGILSFATLACFIIMTFDKGGAHPLWTKIALGAFVIFLSYGFSSGIQQYKNQSKQKGIYLISAILVFTILFGLTAVNHLFKEPVDGNFQIDLNILTHLHALFLMIIMGIQIIFEIHEKYRLEKALHANSFRFQSFMKNVPLLILEFDTSEQITFINSFALHKFGYSHVDELVNKNFSELLVHEKDIQTTKDLFKRVIQNEAVAPVHLNHTHKETHKQLIINWSYYLNHGSDGHVISMVAIGRDVTHEESTQRLVDQLKLELEKENILQEQTTDLESKIIGTSKAIGYALQKAKLVATTHAPVLLEGETGVGKELVADLIHDLSSRSNMPLIKVNCGALPKELIEDELFGHEKGAFTSAIQSRKGRFELANGGTIFLDEIGELPLDMQPKLLRVLQNGEFERVGGQKTIKVDVRIIAATNRNLALEVSNGRYRDDLFYRLNVYPITIPALRKRKEDLPALIHYFIAAKSKKYEKNLHQISKADMQRLMDYSWPGNVRELKNVIERSVIASEGDTLKLEWAQTQESDHINLSLDTLEQMERNHILKIMEECHWKINGDNGAAERLNMNPNTLRSKMKKLGISRPVKNLS